MKSRPTSLLVLLWLAVTWLCIPSVEAHVLSRYLPFRAQPTCADAAAILNHGGASRLFATKSNAGPALSSAGLSKASFRCRLPRPEMLQTKALAEASLPTIHGLVAYSAQLGDGTYAHQPSRIWSFTPDGNNFTLVSGDNVVRGTHAGVMADGTYYQGRSVKQADGSYLFYIDAYDGETWQQKSSTPVDISSIATAMVYDKGVVYGCFYDRDSGAYVFGKMALNPSAGYPVTPISDIEDNKEYNSMVVDENGTIYAIDFHSYLKKVNKQTGETSYINDNWMEVPYLSSAVYDKNTKSIYWNAIEDDEVSCIYKISIPNGYFTKYATLEHGDEILGMYIPATYADGVPAAPTDFQTSFTDGSLQGTVSFKAPTTTYGGSAATGQLSYRVLANGNQVASGTTEYGADVTTGTIYLSSADYYAFAVILTNADGDGPSAGGTYYIGKDTPLKPVVHAEYGDGKFTVTWEPVTASANGGYINPDDVTYTVTRFPDNVTVATDISETAFHDPYYLPDSYCVFYYEVTAKYDGRVSAPGVSNRMEFNVNTTPWTEGFDTEEAFDLFTVVDANGDGNTFRYNDYNASVSVQGNPSMDMDDWLIAPPVKLEAGKIYQFKLSCFTNAFMTANDRLEVCLGTDRTVESMTQEIIPESPTGHGKDFEQYFNVAADGTYYIGVHGCSPADETELYISNISLAGVDGAVPGAITDLKATSDPDGAMYITISGIAPAVDALGNPLEEIDEIVIEYDERRVGAVEASPGAEFSTQLKVSGKAKFYKVSVYAVNSYGPGIAGVVGDYTGIFEPEEVTGISIEECAEGNAQITWNAPTTDVHGHNLDASELKYSVYDASTGDVLTENLCDTSYTWETGAVSEQVFLAAVVYAHTSGGDSQPALSEMCPMGQAWRPAYIESFDNGNLSAPIGVSSFDSSTEWGITTPGSLLSDDADNTNGFAVAKFKSLKDEGAMYLGKIDLSAAADPSFSFATYNIYNEESGNANINRIEVLVNEGGGWQTLLDGTVDELCGGNRNVWSTLTMSLAPYRGKVVRLCIKVTAALYTYLPLDAIKVLDNVDVNLTAASLQAPATVKRGEAFDLRLKVINNGKTAVEGGDYSVQLFKNDAAEPVATLPGVDLVSLASNSFVFSQTLTFDDAASNTFFAKVLYAADQNQADNTSVTVTVDRFSNAKEAPSALTVEKEGDDSARLNWIHDLYSGPDSEIVTEDFEGYDSFANNGVGEWTFVDADQAEIGGFQDVLIPGIERESLQSFFVFDASHPNFSTNETFAPHSGDKFLAAMYAVFGDDCDDWLISPELSGNAQTVSFYAKSYSSSYPETIEVYYTTEYRKATASFTNLVQTFSDLPEQWTKYTFEVPEGAMFFAIRSVGSYNYMLMLDDITYERRIDKPTGFHVYRDEEKLNDAPVAALSFTDMQVPDSFVSYRVTAYYPDGTESEPSNAATLTSSGIGDVASELSVTAGKGIITVEGAEGRDVSVLNPAGITVYTGKADATLRVRVAEGIWIVRVGKEAFRLIVK